MNLDMFRAYVKGYEDRIFDQQCIAVMQGYWAGYYHSKKPKSPKTVLEKMVAEHEKADRKERNKNVPKPSVDVEAFIAQDQKFKKLYAEQQKRKQGK